MSYPNIFEFQEDFEQSEDLLGKGTYGVVYRMKSKRKISEQQVYAVKFLSAQSERSFQSIQKEFLIFRSLPQQHPHIITLYKTYAWANQLTKTYNLVLAMELADRSLQTEIDARRISGIAFEEATLISIFRQCFIALNDMKTQANVYHRDLKPENIMLMADSFHVKITDFGVSRKLMEEKLSLIPGTLVGTPVYLSPILWQSFEKGEFNVNKVGKIPHNFERSDVYSLGISFLQCALLLKGEVAGLNKGVVGEQRTVDFIDQIKSPRIKKVLERMLVHDEKLRAGYQELLQLTQEQPPVQKKQPIFAYLAPKNNIKERNIIQYLEYNLSLKLQQE